MVFGYIEQNIEKSDREGARNAAVFQSLAILWGKVKEYPQRNVGGYLFGISQEKGQRCSYEVSVYDSSQSLGNSVGIAFIGGDIDSIRYFIDGDVKKTRVTAHRGDTDESVSVTLESDPKSFNDTIKDFEEIGLPFLKRMFELE